MTYQIFSCPCLYAECMMSVYEKETFEQLEMRIAVKTSGKYWIGNHVLNPTITLQLNEKRWVCCIVHAMRMLDNMVLTSTQQQALVGTCVRRNMDNYRQNYMNCFSVFFEDKMPAIGFCTACMRHLLSRTPQSFLLHRVKIYNGNKEDDPYSL